MIYDIRIFFSLHEHHKSLSLLLKTSSIFLEVSARWWRGCWPVGSSCPPSCSRTSSGGSRGVGAWHRTPARTGSWSCSSRSPSSDTRLKCTRTQATLHHRGIRGQSNVWRLPKYGPPLTPASVYPPPPFGAGEDQGGRARTDFSLAWLEAAWYSSGSGHGPTWN